MDTINQLAAVFHLRMYHRPAGEPRVAGPASRNAKQKRSVVAVCGKPPTLALRREEVTAFFVSGLTASIHARIDFPAISLARGDFNHEPEISAGLPSNLKINLRASSQAVRHRFHRRF